jgi:hypothetical protein
VTLSTRIAFIWAFPYLVGVIGGRLNYAPNFDWRDAAELGLIVAGVFIWKLAFMDALIWRAKKWEAGQK